MTRAVIKGVGAYLPSKRLTNADLEKMVQTSDTWIRERTGIQERRIAADDELTSDLARYAALEALQDAGLTASDIDLIILATTTPDDTFPATACKVQQQLGMTGGFAFDIQAACSGFLYALSVADAYITQGRVHRVLVIGAETLSRIVDWTDRNTCVLFGDGAGAVVLEGQSDNNDSSGILSVLLRSDGHYRDLLLSSGGVSRTQTAGFIHMAGREVFRHAVENMAQIAKDVLQQQGLTPADIDCLVPHQANVRIIEATRTKLSLPADKVILTLQQQGNTSAASIPLALHAGVRSGRIQRRDLLLLESMGGGLTWGAGLIRF